ncbi:MAG: hypothetical protein HPY85_06680 [Anaerolineae bacterium]|nr:hypothetical protein [Anaerolineae bacterium]
MDEETLKAFDHSIEKSLPQGSELVDFNTWIIDKYREWVGNKVGNEGSLTAYAEYLGINYEVVRSWVSKTGKTARDYRHVDALAKVYGINVYHILGIDPPDPSLNSLPPQSRQRFLAAMTEIEKQIGLRNLSLDSPEALELSERIFAEHGIIVTDAKRSSSSGNLS